MARYTHPLRLLFTLVLALIGIGERCASGGGFEALHRFPIVGTRPAGLVRGPDGFLYGVTREGTGSSGTLYRISPNSGAFETLANFGGEFGSIDPTEIVVDSAGNVFGVSRMDVLWRWNSTTGLVQIAKLKNYGLGGGTEIVLNGDEGIIGTALFLNTGKEVLWEWRPSTGVRRIAEIERSITGSYNSGRVVRDQQGAIYGCSDSGILWRWIEPGGFAKLATLDLTEFGYASRISVDASGQIWGAASAEGAWGRGTLWRWNQSAGLVKLADFNRDTNVGFPTGPICFGTDGTAFGVSPGAIWKWTSESGLARVAQLTDLAVRNARGSIIIDGSGAIFGTSDSDGSIGGSVWKWGQTSGVTSLRTFVDPFATVYEAGIVKDAQGRFYGVTRSSSNVPQSLWRWSLSGGFETLGVFDYSTIGSGPTDPVIDSAGNVFGVASGGANSNGTLWRWSEGAGLIKLADFPSNIDRGGRGIVLGESGQIYGIRPGFFNSAPFRADSMWKWTAETGFVLVGELSGKENRFSPNRSGVPGVWYGTGKALGDADSSTLWSWSESEAFQLRFTFPRAQIADVGVVLASDSAGSIYGTSTNYPTSTARLWKWNVTSGLTILSDFNFARTGLSPQSISVSADGIVYGTCALGGAYGIGTIWTWREGGELCAVHHFSSQIGGPSFGTGLDLDTAGNLTGVSNRLLWRLAENASSSTPIVATGGVLQNDGFNVEIAGGVDPGGALANVSIQFGTDPLNLSTTVPAVPSVVPEGQPRNVIGRINGLSQRRTYYARFVAENAEGSVFGNLLTFNTANAVPKVADDVIHCPPINGAPIVLDVLTNDEDGEDELRVAWVTNGQFGEAIREGDKIHYFPGANFKGSDTFWYGVLDTFDEMTGAVAKVTITNQGISASDDLIEPGAGTTSFNPLLNDLDLDGDSLTISAVTQPRYGTVSFSANEITYVPDLEFTGTERLVYTVTDSRGESATASVRIRPAPPSREVLHVGRVLPSADGDLTVKRIGSAGSLRGGLLRVQIEKGGLRGWALVNTEDLSVLLKAGGPIPNVEGSTVKSIDKPSGRAFCATFSAEGAPRRGWRAVLFVDGTTGLRLVAREGEIFPDGSSITSVRRFDESNGKVFLLADVRQATGQTVQSLRVWEDGVVDELVRTGTNEVLGGSVKTIASLVPAPGSPAANRWIDREGRIITRLSFEDSAQALVVFRRGEAPNVVARSGDIVAETIKRIRFGLPALCPEGFAFRSFDSWGPQQRSRWTMWGEDPTPGLRMMAFQYSFAPIPEKRIRISQLLDPVGGEGYHLAYLADTDAFPSPRRALFWLNGPSTKLVAREGDRIPGAGTNTFTRIKSFVLPTNTSAGPAFTALTSGGHGLFATDETGEPITVAKPGMLITFDGKKRRIRSVRALQGSTGPGCGTGAYDEFGRLEAIVKFDDGRESLVHFSLP